MHESDASADPLFVRKRVRKAVSHKATSTKMVLKQHLQIESTTDLIASHCISMWKNKRGYMVPLAARLRPTTYSLLKANAQNFEKFNEALDKAEREFNDA